MFTAVIPTLNRPIDLGHAVVSILSQTVLPDELLIVDQSVDDQSLRQVMSLMQGYDSIKLNYIHDATISGLVDAKRVATNCAIGDIVCFLEDDIVLENDFIEQILKGFTDKTDMIGCCGIVTNNQPRASFYSSVFNIFHRGIYLDKRVAIYGETTGRGHNLVKSNKISGGLSAWRKEIFLEIEFDPENGYFMLEDIDFSTRVENHFGQHLYINPNARLEHNCSPVNREAMGRRHRRKIFEYIMFYKNRRDWAYSNVSLMWLLMGIFLESLFKAVLVYSMWPIKEYFCGLYEGFKSTK